ncbi:hypothetical protein AURDEDRAFT_173968 [Auricularia subglabra TFB-10046 SS5]|uniref:Uncharacterized protein n=1 Tax=Auricularia subglabra (strain TFB-10046 / SS5) TaxID=717982 RepID=J0LH00_AURST|nr:hypothetical protein AURDEDRAFT_173968 [Auricularia subglabra TFB-10046 SS5]
MRSGPLRDELGQAACDCDDMDAESEHGGGLSGDPFRERTMARPGSSWFPAPPLPPPFWRTAWVPPHAVYPRGIAGRDAGDACPTFSGLAFALGLLAGLLIASAAFSGGLWWRHVSRKRRRNHKRLTINPYTGGPHHIITEPAVSPPATVANMVSSTTQLVSATQSQSQPGSPAAIPRSASTRSTAAQSRLRASRSESSLPLPIVHRDAQGKFSTLHQHEEAPSARDRQSGVPASLFSASVADGFRTGAHTSVAYTYTAEPSTATAEHFPRSPISMPTQSTPASPHTQTAAALPFSGPSLRSRAMSLESLARTAVARESVSSVGSTWSSRTRVPTGPPPLPPPTQPLPAIPALESQTTGSSWRSASDEKRLLQLQNALYTSTPASPSSPQGQHHSLHSTARASSLRPLPEAPESTLPVPRSAREDKPFLAEAPPSSYPPMPASPDHLLPGESSRRDTVPPPAYSRPPSRTEHSLPY